MSAPQCGTCGEPILDSDGHPVCESMPQSLKDSISRCPDCGHVEGKHMEVTSFDETTWRLTAVHALCECGCDYYLRAVSA